MEDLKNNKQGVIILALVSVLIFTTIAVLISLNRNSNDVALDTQGVPSGDIIQSESIPNQVDQVASFTASEVSLKSSATECWVIINAKVYNVTNYIPFHPGGPSEIIDMCGTDATEAFKSKGDRGQDHSASAYSMLSQYYIGDLSE